MHETLASESTGTGLRKLWGEIHPGGRYFALRRGWHSGVAVDPSTYAAGRRNTRICARVGNNAGPNTLAVRASYRSKECIGGFVPAESTLGTLRIQRASAPRDSFRRAVGDRLACVALVLLVLVAVLISPIQRSSASDSQRPPDGLRPNFALPATDASRLSASARIMREDTVVTVRWEDDEDDEPCSATRPAYDTYDPSLCPSRSAPARNLAVPSRHSALHPLRC
jgi:hypothetical protein